MFLLLEIGLALSGKHLSISLFHVLYRQGKVTNILESMLQIRMDSFMDAGSKNFLNFKTQ